MRKEARYKFNAKELDPETGNYYYGARYYEPQISMWMSVDPMSSERSWLTPYNFVQNNPVNLVDPTGMLDHGYKVDANGNISDKPVDNTGGDEFDVIYNEDMSKTSLPVKPGILGNGQAKGSFDGVDYKYFNVEDQDQAENIFHFLSENTDVEFSRMQYVDEDYGPTSTISTTGEKGNEIGGSHQALIQNRNGRQVNSLDHSHPESKARYSGPSGYHITDPTRGGKSNDLNTAKTLERSIPNIKLRVYDVKTRDYIPYNSKGPVK